MQHTQQEGQPRVRLAGRDPLGALAVDQSQSGSIAQALGFDADALAQEAIELGRIQLSMGQMVLDPAALANLAKADYRGLMKRVRHVRFGLGLNPAVVTGSGVQPQQLADDTARKRAVDGLRLLAARLKVAGLDTMLSVVSLQVFLLNTVMGWLDQQLKRQDLTSEQRDDLVADFAPVLALLQQNRLQQQASDSKQAGAEADLQDQIAHAQADLKELEVLLALQQDQEVPLSDLGAVAQASSGEEEGAGAASAGPAAPTKKKRAPRKPKPGTTGTGTAGVPAGTGAGGASPTGRTRRSAQR